MRIERDLIGEKEVPEEAYWGINTQRAIENFKISGTRFPNDFLISLVLVKKACLKANTKLGLIGDEKGGAILKAIDEILLEKKFLDQFPLDIFQSGSGTQINMNMNEVLANRANELLGHPKGEKSPVHPNDDVNKGQSSNDVVSTAMHLAALIPIRDDLKPSIDHIQSALKKKIEEFKDVIKVGRTHLQDAVPIPLRTEFSVYERQIELSLNNIEQASSRLLYIPLGGTAVGTGINAHERFGEMAVANLSDLTGIEFKENPVKAEAIASHNAAVQMSAALRGLALGLLKMANDIRWMGSGPRAGLGELILPPNEPGSSIMPGKVNPTQSESLIQVCLQVIGNDMTISQAEAFGSTLDLNVAKPLIIVNLLESLKLLSNGMNSFADNCLTGLRPDIEQIEIQLRRNLMIVTNLTKIIGYEKAGEIAKIAQETGKTIREVVLEQGILKESDIDELLDPKKMV